MVLLIRTTGLFEDAGHFDAARAHELDVGLGTGVAVREGALLLGLAPEDFVVAVGVEGRVNVDEVNAGVGELAELFEAIAAIDDTGVHQRGGPPGGLGRVFLQPRRLPRGVGGIRALFRSHGPRIWGRPSRVNDAARDGKQGGALASRWCSGGAPVSEPA